PLKHVSEPAIQQSLDFPWPQRTFGLAHFAASALPTPTIISAAPITTQARPLRTAVVGETVISRNRGLRMMNLLSERVLEVRVDACLRRRSHRAGGTAARDHAPRLPGGEPARRVHRDA